MTPDEGDLLVVLGLLDDPNFRAIMLQNFISEIGPLSEEAAKKVRELLDEGHASD